MTGRQEAVSQTARHALIALAAGVLAVAVGFLVVTRAIPEPDHPKVSVVGDSLTAQSTWAILDQLDGHGYQATVAGVNGATIGDQLHQISSLTLPGSTEVMVIALGTNNAFFATIDDSRHRDLRDSVADVRKAAGLVFEGEPGQNWKPSVRCLVWVNVNDTAGWMGLDRNAPALNQAITSEVNARRAQGRSVVLADWATASRSHPEWFLGDGVHFTTAGEQAYAELIRSAVQECPRSSP